MKKISAALVCAFLGIARPANAADDLIFKAMSDELERTMHRLELPGHPKPYFVSYQVDETETRRLGASFGALIDKDENHNRSLNVDVRIGNYKQDSSSSGMGDWARHSFFAHMHSLTTDNDYTVLRRDLWLQTDEAYKHAIEGMESNLTYLKQNTVEDKPDSFSQEKPVVHLEDPAHIDFDADKWTTNLRKVSAIFKNYLKIVSSKAEIGFSSENKWYLNNEGFKYRTADTGYSLLISAQAQSPDGMTESNDVLIPAYHESELPSEPDMEKSAKALADTLDQLSSAPLAEDYRGPIVFEGQAAAEYFHQVLEARLENSSSPLMSMLTSDKDKLGVRILPKFISVVDDPQAKKFNGQDLFGTYVVDDEGVEGQKITLVDKGILKTLCMGRTPTRKIKQSNGHARQSGTTTSNLFIIADKSETREALKAKLIELGKEDGLSDVYIVRKMMSTPAEMDFSSMLSMMRSVTGGGSFVTPPALLYRVSTENGNETLVRGASFSNLTVRSLRDIEAAGDDSAAYPVTQGHQINSLVTPSILIKEVELQKAERSNMKGPILKNPYFEK